MNIRAPDKDVEPPLCQAIAAVVGSTVVNVLAHRQHGARRCQS
jgi:hypothetical protein